MKYDLTTGTWQDNTGCPISIILVSTSDVVVALLSTVRFHHRMPSCDHQRSRCRLLSPINCLPSPPPPPPPPPPLPPPPQPPRCCHRAATITLCTAAALCAAATAADAAAAAAPLSSCSQHRAVALPPPPRPSLVDCFFSPLLSAGQ